MARVQVAIVCGMAAVLLSVGGCGMFGSELKQTKATLAETQADLEKAQAGLGELNEEWMSLTRDLKALRTAAEKEKRSLWAQLGQAKEVLVAANRQHKNVMKPLRQAAATAVKDKQALTRTVTTLRQEVARLEKTIKTLRADIAALRKAPAGKAKKGIVIE